MFNAESYCGLETWVFKSGLTGPLEHLNLRVSSNKTKLIQRQLHKFNKKQSSLIVKAKHSLFVCPKFESIAHPTGNVSIKILNQKLL